MSIAATESGVALELGRICGGENVVEDPAALEAYAIDEAVPAIAVAPASAEEVAAILRFAGERDLVVVPAGGCSGQHTGAIPEGIDILLRMERMQTLDFYDPGDLTVGVGAGCTAAALNQRLATNRQFLPLDVPASNRATIGGILATAARGPLSFGFGGIRDFCIGIRFVTGDGKITKAGGRVVKNVTGYDLMKLLIGSYGTLGVIVSANFKVFPLPQSTRTFLLEFAQLNQALEFCDGLMRSPLTPIALELMNSRALEYFEAHQALRDPDHYAPGAPVASGPGEWQLALRAAGADTVLARYRRELGAAVTRELEGDEETAHWNAIANLSQSVFARHQNAMSVNLNFPPATASHALFALERAALDNNLLPVIAGRIALGAMTIAFVPLAVDPPSAMQYVTAISALRAALPEGASCVVTRCPSEAKRHFDVWGPTQTHRATMLAVKRALDPKNILNRGRFLVG